MNLNAGSNCESLDWDPFAGRISRLERNEFTKNRRGPKRDYVTKPTDVPTREDQETSQSPSSSAAHPWWTLSRT